MKIPRLLLALIAGLVATFSHAAASASKSSRGMPSGFRIVSVGLLETDFLRTEMSSGSITVMISRPVGIPAKELPLEALGISNLERFRLGCLPMESPGMDV